MDATNKEGVASKEEGVALAVAETPPGGPLIEEYHIPQLRSYPSWLAYLTAFVTIVSGVYSSMAFKWQNKQTVVGCDGCGATPFEGALLQTQLMFVGESLALIIWWIDDILSKRKDKALLFDFIRNKVELARRECSWWRWPICSILDFTSTLMINYATIVTYASTVQMLRNFMVVISAIAQMVLVRKALRVHEWIGVFVITGAMVLTAVPAFGTPDDTIQTTQAKITLGIILCIIGTSVQAVQLLFEEMNFRSGRFPLLKAVGLEGVSGLCWSFIAWAPYQASGAEDVTMSWYQQTHSGILVAIALVYLVGAVIFNAAGLATTKLAGGVLRAICFACRAPIVWLVSMIVKWQTYDNWNLASMLVFIVGFMFYINLIPGDNALNVWLAKPVHMCCTDPNLDGVMPGQEGLIQEERPNERSSLTSHQEP